MPRGGSQGRRTITRVHQRRHRDLGGAREFAVPPLPRDTPGDRWDEPRAARLSGARDRTRAAARPEGSVRPAVAMSPQTEEMVLKPLQGPVGLPKFWNAVLQSLVTLQQHVNAPGRPSIPAAGGPVNAAEHRRGGHRRRIETRRQCQPIPCAEHSACSCSIASLARSGRASNASAPALAVTAT
jgi:hypothetical protein